MNSSCFEAVVIACCKRHAQQGSPIRKEEVCAQIKWVQKTLVQIGIVESTNSYGTAFAIKHAVIKNGQVQGYGSQFWQFARTAIHGNLRTQHKQGSLILVIAARDCETRDVRSTFFIAMNGTSTSRSRHRGAIAKVP